MPIPQNIKSDLLKKELTPFHRALLEDTKELVEMSREQMCQHYEKWDAAHDTFRALMVQDKKDREAAKRKEPERMVVPTAFSQIMTFAAFCYSLYTQRERVFELTGVSEEDHEPAKIGEALLARDLSENQFEIKLFQFLLDICRFTIGVWEVTWVHERRMMMQEVEQGPLRSFFGKIFGSGVTEQEVEVTTYLGNRISNISPYRFFPDTRLPLTRFQEGEFVAVEDEFSYSALKQLEQEGVVFGVDQIPALSIDTLKERSGESRMSFDLTAGRRGTNTSDVGQSRHPILVTKVQRNIIPSKYEVDGEPLGPEEYPQKWVIWYANDRRVIKAERLTMPSGRFTYEMSQFVPDQHDLIGLSFMDVVDKLQSVISWFINSHITSVRKVISNYLIVDPTGVEMKDLENRNPVIRLKPAAGGRGVERFVQQLAVQDVTKNHLTDVKMLRELVQESTGVSDNMLGQFNSGRRSATEARNVSGGAASRLKMLAAQIYRSSLEPMAKQMLENLRVGLDEETIVKVVGIGRAQRGANFKKVSKSDLAGDYAFEVFDGTLPSEKSFIAQALQELLVALMSNPESAIALQMDPRAILLEVLELRGVRNPERFSLGVPPIQQNAGIDPNNPGGEAPGVPGADGESVLPGISQILPLQQGASPGGIGG